MEVVLSGNMKQLLEPILRKVFFDQYAQIPSVRGQLFAEVGSKKATETDFSMGSLGTIPEFKGTLEYDTFEGLWAQTYTHKEYAKGIRIQRKDIDDDQYNIIIKQPQQLALALARTQETHAASVFNNAFTTGYNGPDSVVLCSASHPYSPTNASVQDNADTAALTLTALQTAKLNMRKWYDDRGNKMLVQPDTLLVPPDLEDTARILLETEKYPGNAQNDINPLRRNAPKVIVWDYLSSTTAWFLIDSALMKQNLLWFTRIPVEFRAAEKDFDTQTFAWSIYTRYSYGFNDWRWVYGSTGTA